MLALQEPAISRKNLAIGITSHWYTIYPTNHLLDNQPKTRSLLLIGRSNSTNAWKTVPIESADVTAVELTTDLGKVQIINVYNDGGHDKTVETLHRHLNSVPRSTSVILLGDFNRHHPMWDEPRNQHLFTQARLDAAQTLINLLDDHGLQMALPPGTPTHELMTTKNPSRLDNVFMTDSLIDRTDTCTAPNNPRIAYTDHFSVLTILHLKSEQASTNSKHNFRRADWEVFCEALESRLTTVSTDRIHDIADFDSRLSRLTEAIQETIEEKVPKVKLCPYTKRWWTKELKEMQKRHNQLSNQSGRHRADHDTPIPH